MRISTPRSHLHVQQVACFCLTKPQPDLGVRKTVRLCSMKQHKTSPGIAVTKCLLAFCSSSPYCPCWHIARQAWSWSAACLSCAADLAFVWDTWVLVLCNWFLWHAPLQEMIPGKFTPALARFPFTHVSGEFHVKNNNVHGEDCTGEQGCATILQSSSDESVQR